jgi:hypothetical protein
MHLRAQIVVQRIGFNSDHEEMSPKIKTTSGFRSQCEHADFVNVETNWGHCMSAAGQGPTEIQILIHATTRTVSLIACLDKRLQIQSNQYVYLPCVKRLQIQSNQYVYLPCVKRLQNLQPRPSRWYSVLASASLNVSLWNASESVVLCYLVIAWIEIYCIQFFTLKS